MTTKFDVGDVIEMPINAKVKRITIEDGNIEYVLVTEEDKINKGHYLYFDEKVLNGAKKVNECD